MKNLEEKRLAEIEQLVTKILKITSKTPSSPWTIGDKDQLLRVLQISTKDKTYVQNRFLLELEYNEAKNAMWIDIENVRGVLYLSKKNEGLYFLGLKSEFQTRRAISKQIFNEKYITMLINNLNAMCEDFQIITDKANFFESYELSWPRCDVIFNDHFFTLKKNDKSNSVSSLNIDVYAGTNRAVWSFDGDSFGVQVHPWSAIYENYQQYCAEEQKLLAPQVKFSEVSAPFIIDFNFMVEGNDSNDKYDFSPYVQELVWTPDFEGKAKCRGLVTIPQGCYFAPKQYLINGPLEMNLGHVNEGKCHEQKVRLIVNAIPSKAEQIEGVTSFPHQLKVLDDDMYGYFYVEVDSGVKSIAVMNENTHMLEIQDISSWYLYSEEIIKEHGTALYAYDSLKRYSLDLKNTKLLCFFGYHGSKDKHEPIQRQAKSRTLKERSIDQLFQPNREQSDTSGFVSAVAPYYYSDANGIMSKPLGEVAYYVRR